VRTLALPKAIESWSLTSLRERLTKTRTRFVRHGHYALFQTAEAALPRSVFAGIIDRINALRGPPAMAASASPRERPDRSYVVVAKAEPCRRETGLASKARRFWSDSPISWPKAQGCVPIEPNAGWRHALTGRRMSEAWASGKCWLKAFEAFPFINMAQVDRHREPLHCTAQEVHALNLPLEAPVSRLDQAILNHQSFKNSQRLKL